MKDAKIAKRNKTYSVGDGHTDLITDPNPFVNAAIVLNEYAEAMKDAVSKFQNMPDEKTEARARSKADVKAKRRDMMKRRK